MDDRIRLPIICGPTASGKTACAVEVCKKLGGEVVSADSMQLFRGMEVLSAAPTIEERRGIIHHMIGIAEPTQPFSAAIYRDHAVECIYDIFSRGKQPVLCGGTGLYIDAVTRGMTFSEQSDPELRDKLHNIANLPGGRQKLHAMLAEIDPASAERLHYNDVRRVVRAIEVYKLSGITLTEQNRRDSERQGEFNEMLFALDWPRDELYARIDKRVDEMLENGLIHEVMLLMQAWEDQPTAVQAIGYKEIAAYIRGDISLDDAVIQMKRASRNYAKRQVTWLKRDKRSIWISASGRSAESIAEEIAERYGSIS